MLGFSSSRRDEDIEKEKDKEYKRVMARLDELEKEEEEAGSYGEEESNDVEDEIEQPGVSDSEGGSQIPTY
jgi:unconventional prefoldin RPB5 interactor 1